MGEPTIRDQIVAMFREALGEPEVAEAKRGSMYYWTLERGRYEISMYVTIDSPKWTDLPPVFVPGFM